MTDKTTNFLKQLQLNLCLWSCKISEALLRSCGLCEEKYWLNQHIERWWMGLLWKLWVSQNFGQISRVSQSCFFSGHVCLAVLIFIQSPLGVSIFCKAAKWSGSLDSFVCFYKKKLMKSSRHLIMTANILIIKRYFQISEKKLIFLGEVS